MAAPKASMPLHRAAQAGKEKSVLQQLRSGRGINQQDQHGNTPLHYAVMGGRYAVARLLLQHGAQLNRSNHAGYLPDELIVGSRAIARKERDAWRRMLERGGDDAVDNDVELTRPADASGGNAHVASAGKPRVQNASAKEEEKKQKKGGLFARFRRRRRGGDDTRQREANANSDSDSGGDDNDDDDDVLAVEDLEAGAAGASRAQLRRAFRDKMKEKRSREKEAQKRDRKRLQERGAGEPRVSSLGTTELTGWLTDLGQEKYAGVFYAAGYEMLDDVKYLGQLQLDQLGITNKNDRMRLLNAARHLKQGGKSAEQLRREEEERWQRFQDELASLAVSNDAGADAPAAPGQWKREPSSVDVWLGELVLGAYGDVFWEQGYEKLSSVAWLSEHDMDALGVRDAAHRERLTKAVARLRWDMDQHPERYATEQQATEPELEFHDDATDTNASRPAAARMASVEVHGVQEWGALAERTDAPQHAYTAKAESAAYTAQRRAEEESAAAYAAQRRAEEEAAAYAAQRRAEEEEAAQRRETDAVLHAIDARRAAAPPQEAVVVEEERRYDADDAQYFGHGDEYAQHTPHDGYAHDDYARDYGDDYAQPQHSYDYGFDPASGYAGEYARDDAYYGYEGGHGGGYDQQYDGYTEAAAPVQPEVSVKEWLDEHDLGEYATAFKVAGVLSLEQMLEIDDARLEAMGIQLHERMRFNRAIRALQRQFW